MIDLVSGSWPPETCGVGDHIDALRKALCERGIDARPVRLAKYGLLQTVRLIVRSWITSDSKAILAYPTEGYGRSVLPFFLILCRPGSVLLHMHEYRHKNMACRWLLRLYRKNKAIFFSNTDDMTLYLHDTHQPEQIPGRIRKVMPSPSTIQPVRIEHPASHTGHFRILHFGQIRPRKGIEEVVEVFKHLKSVEPSVQLTIAGAVPQGYEYFANEIDMSLAGSDIALKLELAASELSETISQSDAIFLPYPDGADERRSTLAAGLAHGAVCVTTYKADPDESLKKMTIGIAPVSAAPSRGDWVRSSSQQLMDACSQARAGKCDAMIAAALQYSGTTSFQTLADETLKALYSR